MISYTVPLITSDGQVYGVLGMEITLDYLSTMLPYEELMNDRNDASYLVLVKNDADGTYQTIFSSDSSCIPQGEELHIRTTEDGLQYIDMEEE